VKTLFIRAIEREDKAAVLRSAAQLTPMAASVFPVTMESFQAIPRSPFAYWASDEMRLLFRRLGAFETGGRSARTGLSTEDDFRFVRNFWEPRNRAPVSWPSLVRGGKRSPFYAAFPAVIDWLDAGRELKALTIGRYGSAGKRVYNEEFYFRPGLSWPLRGIRFSAFAVGEGAVFSVAGKMAFAPPRDLAPMLAIFNSAVFDRFVGFFAGKIGGVQYEVGLIQVVPMPNLTPANEAALSSLARRAWSLKQSLDTRTETSQAFVLPALLQTEGRTLAGRSAAWTERAQAVEAELAAIQVEIDERCFTLYGMDEEDRRAITEGFGGTSPDAETSEDGTDAGTEDEAEAEAAPDSATLAAELVSWAAGVAFGRFDVRLATGARDLPAEPEPFDPLRVCSPAMLTGDDGLPLPHPPAGYPLTFPEDGILVDDPGHPRDLTAAVRAVFDAAFGASADAVWQEAAALLDPKGHDLRTWLAKEFFGHHLARHSKSRRKAPILWQLGTPSGRYSTWCYAHRLTRDSLFALARDVVAPKLALEERRQSDLVGEAGPNPTAKQRAELAAQDAVVAELRPFAEEVRRVAPLWNPDLDDGIVLVSAPLWRLVPHKPWTKELKGRWDDLVAGKYDWAHLAMHLWPERVVPKCSTDRSLAIAHGLEDVFWAEGADGKWTRRARPTRTIEDLVAERTSPAVKAALADLLAAPAPSAGGRGRGRS
jgi:hypothetical protein